MKDQEQGGLEWTNRTLSHLVDACVTSHVSSSDTLHMALDLIQSQPEPVELYGPTLLRLVRALLSASPPRSRVCVVCVRAFIYVRMCVWKSELVVSVSER